MLAHSSGGPAPIVTFVTVHADGRLEMQEDGETAWARVHSQEAREIISRMQKLEELLRRVQPLADQYGCCDHEEVYVKSSTIEITIPVRYEEIVATTPALATSEHYLIPTDLADVLRSVEMLIVRAFRRRPAYTLVPSGAG